MLYYIMGVRSNLELDCYLKQEHHRNRLNYSEMLAYMMSKLAFKQYIK